MVIASVIQGRQQRKLQGFLKPKLRILPCHLFLLAKARHKTRLKCTNLLLEEFESIVAIVAICPKAYLRTFFLLILVYAKKKEWRTLQRKLLFLLLIELFFVTITYTNSVVYSHRLFIVISLLLLFTYTSYVSEFSECNREGIHNTFSHAR